MINLVTRILLVALALLLIAHFVPGIEVASIYTAVIVALVLGVMNITIKPVLLILTLPISLLTFGLFTFVVNALLFWFVSTFIEGFHVDGFLPALLGAVGVSLVSWAGHRFFS